MIKESDETPVSSLFSFKKFEMDSIQFDLILDPSFNAKVKEFRNQFKGLKKIEFFLFRLTNIYA